jgi:putative RNA 2'-phosphotransferase
MAPELVAVSKRLSYVLRHDPSSVGLTLGSGRWVAVDTLLAALAEHGRAVDRATLDRVVAENDKRRFERRRAVPRDGAGHGHLGGRRPGRLDLSPFVLDCSPTLLTRGLPLPPDASRSESITRRLVRLSRDLGTAVRVTPDGAQVELPSRQPAGRAAAVRS